MAPTPAELERALLHRGGRAADWGSLGLWLGAADYAGACSALADAVGRGAGLQPGERVLSAACGAGEELLRWAGHFGAASVLGIERDPALAARARQRVAARPWAAAITVLAGDALDMPPRAGPFDALVCVDAAYHLAPRERWLAQAFSLLRPGGRIAYTDLVLAHGAASWPLRAAAALCGVPSSDLLDLDGQVQRLRDAGFDEPAAQALDDAVLGGFARFVRDQARTHGFSPWQAGWRRPAWTAALIPPCRAAGLGYALVTARKP